jgi:hypothetical protein
MLGHGRIGAIAFVECHQMQLIHHSGAHLHQSVAMPRQLPQITILCIPNQIRGKRPSIMETMAVEERFVALKSFRDRAPGRWRVRRLGWLRFRLFSLTAIAGLRGGIARFPGDARPS